MKRVSIFVLFILMVQGISAQDNGKAEEKMFGVKFSGFVKNDFFWDTRQTVAAREGHFLLWPSAENLDATGVDINAGANFNFLAIQSRLSGKISGPDAFGAKTSGLIEGDFFAQANDNINLFRLRHAFIKLNWENTEVLTGQSWNPLFVSGCFPGTVSFNTGTPFQSFARNSQVRLTQKIGGLSIIAAALGQRDFNTRGPDPANNLNTAVNSSFLRNSALPDMHLQVHYGSSNPDAGTGLLAGVGAAYKVIRPRLSSVGIGGTYSVNEKVPGMTAIVFSKLTTSMLTFKLQGRYGENIADVLAISGFAVKEIVDLETLEQSYTPLKSATVWGEIHSNGKKTQLGVFGAIYKNLGTVEAMSAANNPVYGLATNIESLFRVSPRITYTSGKVKLGCELEYTSAAYGTGHDVNYIPSSTNTVANTRLLLSAIYSF